jgi:hypothetical protein
VLIILLAAGFFWLVHGISIEKLDLGRYKIVGLYIKLDKKLTLKAKELTLPQNKSNPSFDRVDRTFDNIKHLLAFFDTIMLERINFQNNHITLLYSEDVLYITSDIYEIAGNIERKGQKLIADVALLYLKREDVTLSGNLSYDLKENTLETEGIFEGYGISGDFRAQKHGDEIRYALKTDRFNDVAPVVSHFPLPASISVWITDKVRAKTYAVSYLTGKLSLVKGKIHVDTDSLQGKVHFEDVDIAYKEGVTPAHAKAMDLVYKKGTLYFTLIQPRHKERKLDGTTVTITHVDGSGKAALILDLHVQGPIDEEVHQILHAYGLKIPVTHTGKDDRARVVLDIPLRKKGQKRPPIGVDVYVTLGKGILTIGRFAMKITDANLAYRRGKVTIEKIEVSEKWLKADIAGTVDIKKQDADLALDVKQFMLGDGWLQIRKRKIPLKLSYADMLKLTLSSLGTVIEEKKGQWQIRLKDLSLLTPYFRQGLIDIKGGTLLIRSRDMEHFRYHGNIKSDLCFLYEKNDSCYTLIPVEGKFNKQTGQWILDALGKRLHLDMAKKRIVIQGLNIDLKRLLKRLKQSARGAKNNLLGDQFVILGEKSQLRYGIYRLILDNYDIEIKPNGDIKAIGSLDGDIVKFSKKGHIFMVNALRVTDRMLHPLINFDGLKGGRYSLKKKGDPEKKMKGRIIIEGGILSDFKAYSNTLAFINTLPALATLNNPGFSDKGFKISEGVVEYTMTPKEITFDSVYLKGNSATIVGKGTLDLKHKKLNIDLAIQSVRSLGKVVGKIPILGYILMGDDNSMTVGLKITGTLDHPKVSTSVAKEILTLPLEILKRTITAPAHLGISPQKKELKLNQHSKEEQKNSGSDKKEKKLPVKKKESVEALF